MKVFYTKGYELAGETWMSGPVNLKECIVKDRSDCGNLPFSDVFISVFDKNFSVFVHCLVLMLFFNEAARLLLIEVIAVTLYDPFQGFMIHSSTTKNTRRFQDL
jgi:hypothetical protein